MTRRPRALLAAAVLSAIVVGCGGPPAPELTDPNQIITAALTSTGAATSFHVAVALDGSASVDLPMLGGPVPLTLTGSTASVDVDVQDAALRATFDLPAMFGLAGEVISVGEAAYLKTTLTGQQFEPFDLGGTLPFDPTDTPGMMAGLGDLLGQDGLALSKGGDVACGTRQCYTVTAALTSDQLPGLAGPAASALPVDLAGATLALTILVEKDLPNHLAELEAVLGLGGEDSITIGLTFSRWDEPATIAPPPADPVKPAS